SPVVSAAASVGPADFSQAASAAGLAGAVGLSPAGAPLAGRLGGPGGWGAPAALPGAPPPRPATWAGTARPTPPPGASLSKEGKLFESGTLEDVFIISDARTNSLIILATDKTLELLLALVRELDVLPGVLADVKIFQLKRADAAQTANVLQQLLLGTAAR